MQIRRYFFLFISLIVTIASMAQVKTGRVVDEQLNPVPLANVVLLNRSDSVFIGGVVTKDDGSFVLYTNGSNGLLKVSILGYSTKYVDAAQDSIGDIQIFPNTNALSEIVVNGSRPVMKMINGGVSFDVRHSLLSQAGTAIDVLSELPRVNVSSDGAVDVFGKGTPEIYINNRKVRNKEELLQLVSSDIKAVEVITAPNSSYNAEVSSVIRILTVKRLGDYFGAFLVARGSYFKDAAGAAGASVTYRKNKLEINVYPFYSNSLTAEDNNYSNSLQTNSYLLRTSQHGIFNDRTQSFVPSAKINYDFNTNHSIGLSASTSNTLNYNSSARSDYDIFHDNSLIGTISQRSVHDWDSKYQNVNAYYCGNIGKWNLQTDLTFYHVKTDRGQHVMEISDNLENRTVNTFSSQDSYLYAGKTVATYSLRKGGLIFGVEMSKARMDANSVNPEGYINDSHNEIEENNSSFFASYGVSLGQWNLEAGLRYEHVNSDYYSFGVLDPSLSRKYNDLFPSFSASWNKNAWGLQFSYAKKTRRPAYHQLRSYQQYDNRYSYESGSPDLRPSINHELELTAMWKWVYVSLDYVYLHDNMLWRNDIYGTKDVSYVHWININHKQDFSFSLVLQPQFDWYQPQLTLARWQQSFDASKYGFLSSLARPEYVVNLTNKFVINKSLWFSLQGYYDSLHDSGSQEGSSICAVNLRACKSFMNDNLAINLYVNDIFNSQRERWTMRTQFVETNKDCNNYVRGIQLQVTYYFNYQRSKFKGIGAGSQEKNRL